MTTKTQTPPIAFGLLPTVGSQMEGGTFAGITTSKDGTHHAIVLLPNQGEKLTWKKAMNWAAKLDGELPTRPVAALLFANLKAQLQPNWHWTSDEYDASYAWHCYFTNGNQSYNHKSYEGCAVAVRLIPLTA